MFVVNYFMVIELVSWFVNGLISEFYIDVMNVIVIMFYVMSNFVLVFLLFMLLLYCYCVCNCNNFVGK